MARLVNRRNPVPESKLRQLREGSQLFSDFTGRESQYVDHMPKPSVPDVLVRIGLIDGIMYTTVRDGKTERYIHKFKAGARPVFAVSKDGRKIFLLGGNYRFTHRGIEDYKA